MPSKRHFSLLVAYAIAVLLGLNWASGAAVTLDMPLLDLGVAHSGDAIIGVSSFFGLTPEGTFALARALVSAKLGIGVLLLGTPFLALYKSIRWGEADDTVLDIGLFLSALGTTLGLSPAIQAGGEVLQGAIGELVLCVIATVLVTYARSQPELDVNHAQVP